MNNITVNPTGLSTSYFQKDNGLKEKLSRAKDFLKENDFPDLDFSVHNKHGKTPTIVLVGKYESSRDMDLFTLLDSKEAKNILPESIVVEWMYGDKEFPEQTILETYPNYS